MSGFDSTRKNHQKEMMIFDDNQKEKSFSFSVWIILPVISFSFYY